MSFDDEVKDLRDAIKGLTDRVAHLTSVIDKARESYEVGRT